MSQTAEFIFFKLKPTVKPEGPNDEGNELLKVFNATKQQSGYHSSAWGRTVEDESVVAWIIGTPPVPHTYPFRSMEKMRGCGANDVMQSGPTPAAPATPPN